MKNTQIIPTTPNLPTIMFVAVFTSNSTNVSQSRGFRSEGYGVYEYDFRERLRILGSPNLRDKDLINCVKELSPQIVIFSKGDGISAKTIIECNKYSKTILWYMDAMHNFNQNLIEKIKVVDSFSCGVPGVNLEAKKYSPNVHFVEQCYDDEFNFPINEVVKDLDITFIGNVGSHIHSNRLFYINYLKQNHSLFSHFTGVYGLEHNNIVNRSKINLNFTPIDGTGSSVRLHKILASQGFLMTLPWIGMEKSFTPGKDFVVFTSLKDLKEKTNYYLSNPQERDKIRKHGYRTIQSSHPNMWAKNIINTLN